VSIPPSRVKSQCRRQVVGGPSYLGSGEAILLSHQLPATGPVARTNRIEESVNPHRSLKLLVAPLLLGVAASTANASFPSALANPRPCTHQSKNDEFKKRLAAIDQKDPDALVELALWAKQNGMRLQANALLRKALRRDPDHEKARAALGYVKHDGKWLSKREAAELGLSSSTPKDKATTEAQIGDASAPTRRIVIEVPNEDSSRAKVDREIDKYALSSRDLKGLFVNHVGADADEYSVVTTDHLMILSGVSDEQAKTLAQIGEYVYRRLNWITFGKLETPIFQRENKHRFFLVDKEVYEDMVGFIHNQWPRRFSKKDRDYVIKETTSGGFSWINGMPMHLFRAGDPSSVVANGMGHHWLVYASRGLFSEPNIRHKGNMSSGGRGRGNLMSWMDEGLGIWSAVDAIGTNRLTRVTKSVYKNVGRAEKGEDTEYLAIAYEVATRSLPPGRPVKTFYQLTRAKLNALNDIDLAMSWSIVDYLIRERTADWRRLISIGQKQPSFRAALIQVFGTSEDKKALQVLLRQTHSESQFERLYSKVADHFEQGWREWVAKTYKAQYDDPTAIMHTPPFQPIEVKSDDDSGDKGDDKDKKKKRRRRRRK